MGKRKRGSSSSSSLLTTTTTANGDDEEKSGRMMKKRMKKIHKSRTDCLKKETYELSVLCGVDVALLSFAPDGSLLSSWPENQTEIVPLIQRYKHIDLKKTRSSGLSDLKPKKKKLKLGGLSNNNTVTREFGKSCDFSSLNNPETTTTARTTTNDQQSLEEVYGLVSQYQLLDSKEKEIETLRQRCLNNQGLNGGTKNQDDDLVHNRDHQQSFSINGGNLDCGLLSSSSSIDKKWMRCQERGSTSYDQQVQSGCDFLNFDPVTIGHEDDYEFSTLTSSGFVCDQQVDFVNGDDEIIIIPEWEDEFLHSYFSGLI